MPKIKVRRTLYTGSLLGILVVIYFVYQQVDIVWVEVDEDGNVLEGGRWEDYDNGGVPMPTISYSTKPSRCKLYNDLKESDLQGNFICKQTMRTDSYLTLFTTMFYKANKMNQFNNTIHEWASLTPDINMVMYILPEDGELHLDMKKLLRRACRLGWNVMWTPGCNEFTFPILKTMFQISMRTWTTKWYGFSNADLLFDEGLYQTLSFLHKNVRALNGSIFVTGRRTNLGVPDGVVISKTEDLKQYHDRKKHRLDAEDYFITTGNAYPWETIPRFVVGRKAFDNWVVWKANMLPDVSLIDASRTLMAVHQGKVGRGNDHSDNMAGYNYNFHFTGPWNYVWGCIGAIRYLTNRRVDDNKFVMQDRKSGKIVLGRTDYDKVIDLIKPKARKPKKKKKKKKQMEENKNETVGVKLF